MPLTRALMISGSVLAALLAASAPAMATEDDMADNADVLAAPAPATPCCCCRCAPATSGQCGDPDRRAALALGWTFFGVGTAISVGHSLSGTGTSSRMADLVPIAGPISGVWRNDDSPAWTAALLFSAWSQAVGVLVLALVASDPDSRLEAPPASRSGRDDAVGLSLRF
jgi:hypothetical protein